MTTLPDGLTEWAAHPGPAKLLDAVRVRARRGHRTETGTLSALQLTMTDRREIGLLLGTPWEVSGRPPRLQDLAARLAEHDLTVLGLIELLDGHPIERDSELRRARAAAANAELDQVVAALAACGITDAHARAWLADPGLPRPGSGELTALTDDVTRVWRALPQPPRTTRLAQLAATIAHDAHSLDADRLLGRSVARLTAVVHGLDRPRRAGMTWRTAWASVGVRCDGVSSRVLVLNLPLNGAAPAATWCASARGEPVWLTLRSLSGDWHVPPTTVYVCENPTVVEAAADALSAACPAMVCTDGTASGAALDLLSGLAAAGCRIRYRADFDASGFVIEEQILGVAPAATPWRFDASTYLHVLGIEPTDGTLQSLRRAHGRHDVDVHEERLLDDLIADLTHAKS